jgi:hypothetical protein
MIESFIAVMAFLGFGIGSGDDPSEMAFQTESQQIIRAIDSFELQGLNTLEDHNADEWFV